MAKSRIMLDEKETKEPKLPTGSGTLDQKKEFTPKVRNAGHFLFEQDVNRLVQIDSYPDLKSFQEGVKEKAKAIPDDKPIPNWIHFRGRFDKVEIERIRDVRVRL